MHWSRSNMQNAEEFGAAFAKGTGAAVYDDAMDIAHGAKDLWHDALHPINSAIALAGFTENTTKEGWHFAQAMMHANTRSAELAHLEDEAD